MGLILCGVAVLCVFGHAAGSIVCFGYLSRKYGLEGRNRLYCIGFSAFWWALLLVKLFEVPARRLYAYGQALAEPEAPPTPMPPPQLAAPVPVKPPAPRPKVEPKVEVSAPRREITPDLSAMIESGLAQALATKQFDPDVILSYQGDIP